MNREVFLELMNYHIEIADDAERVAMQGQNDGGWWAARAKTHREFIKLLEWMGKEKMIDANNLAASA